MKLIYEIIGMFVVLLILLVTTIDVVQFHSVQRGNYDTPWYDARWWVEPYTHFRILLADSNERWTKNAVGDDWLVRETVIDGKEWWTILEWNEIDK